MDPTQEQLDIFNSLQGKDNSFYDSLSQDEAAELEAVVDKVNSFKSKPQPTQPTQPAQNQMEMRAATPEEKSFGQGSFMRSANSAVMGVTGGLAAPVMDAAKRASDWFTDKDPEQSVVEPLPSDSYREAQQDAPVSNIAGAFAQPQFSGPNLAKAVMGGLQGATTADSMGQDPLLGAGIGAVTPGLTSGIGAMANKFDEFLLKKVGPAALDWVDKAAERVVSHGSNKLKTIQQLRGEPSMMGLGDAFDDVKYQLINKLKPGITEDYGQVADRLAVQRVGANRTLAAEEGAMNARNQEIGRVRELNDSIEQMNESYLAPRAQAMEGSSSVPKPGSTSWQMKARPLEPVPPELPVQQSTTAEANAAQNLEQIMAPGLNKNISRDTRSGFATTVKGIIANNVIDSGFRRGALATLKTAQTVAQKALKNIDIDMNMAPFQKQTVMQKINAISRMEPTKANAYAYAESMVNPVFRQVWLNAQKEQESK